MVEAVQARFDAATPTQPIEWLTDNGSPYIARDTRRFPRELGLKPLTTAIRSPQSNGMAEAFGRATATRAFLSQAYCHSVLMGLETGEDVRGYSEPKC
jgi:transposase InsO family protein